MVLLQEFDEPKEKCNYMGCRFHTMDLKLHTCKCGCKFHHLCAKETNLCGTCYTKTRSDRPDQTRPDQTRPEQTRADQTTTEAKERDDQCMASLPRMESVSGIEVCQATESAHQILLQVGCFSYVSSQYMIQSVI